MLARVSASGPISAILPCFFSGSKDLSFFSSTKVSAAMRLASARFSAVKMSRLRLFVSQYLYGSAKSPSLYLASSTLRHALLMASSLTVPSFTDCSSVPMNPMEHMSMSVPALRAAAEQSFSEPPTPWLSISPIEP